MEINRVKNTDSYLSKNEIKNVRSSSKCDGIKTADNSKKDDSLQKKPDILTDVFSKSDEVTSKDTGIYTRETITKTLDQCEEQRTEAFVKMISDMLEAQVGNCTLSLSDIYDNIKKNFTEEDMEKAKESISDGGYYSVDAVATRIMDMATALAGDDPSKISVLREAVVKGFGQAAETLGLKEDDMPEITKSTYTEVMKRFDDWEKSYETDTENKTEAETET